MVAVHAGMGRGRFLADSISAFHMPLFYIVSGMCFNPKYLTCGWNFIERKIEGVYLPYLKWSLLFLLLHNVCFRLHLYDAVYGFRGIGTTLYSTHDFLSHARDVIFKMEGHENLLGAFWFMKPLLLGNILFYCVLRLTKNNIWLTLGVIAILACVMHTMNLVIPYVNITYMIPFAAFFVAAGYGIRTMQMDYDKWYVYLACVIIWLAGAAINPHPSMLNQSAMTLLPYMVSAIAGTLLMILISRQVVEKSAETNNATMHSLYRAMCYIGDHTLEVMTLHFVAFKLVSWLIVSRYDLPIEQIAEHPVIEMYAQAGWWGAYLAVGVTVPIIYAYGKDRLLKALECVKTK